MPKQKQINQNLHSLISWSKEKFSHLPWRKNRNFYEVLLAEMMLQQTTVSTVKKKYLSFLKKFPNLESLAKANEEEILQEWSGLGYYRRAKLLHKAAKELANEKQAPNTEVELKKIAGIGEYTANAIIAFCYNQQTFAIDANLRRVLNRFLKQTYTDLALKKIARTKEFSATFKQFSSREFNESLMDLGREVCRENNPLCSQCPLTETCQSSGDDFKKQKKKIQQKIDLDLLRVLTSTPKGILLYKKKDTQWLAGQWELPSFVLNDIAIPQQYPKLSTKKPFLITNKKKSTITKYKITNHLTEIEKLDSQMMNYLKDFQYIFLSKKDFLNNNYKIVIAGNCKKLIQTQFNTL